MSFFFRIFNVIVGWFWLPWYTGVNDSFKFLCHDENVVFWLIVKVENFKQLYVISKFLRLTVFPVFHFCLRFMWCMLRSNRSIEHPGCYIIWVMWNQSVVLRPDRFLYLSARFMSRWNLDRLEFYGRAIIVIVYCSRNCGTSLSFTPFFCLRGC